MTNVWTAVSTTFFGTSWVCDVGPWLPSGQLPIYPPLRPADADEIDYWLGTPNVSGLVADFNDGSYEAYNTSAPALDYYPPIEMPATPHLIVQWWDPAFPSNPADLATPSLLPLDLVPSNYVTGGVLDIGDTVPALPSVTIPFGNPVVMPNQITVDLYDTDGTTHIRELLEVRKVKWLHELSAPGSASFEIPLDNAASISMDRFVRFSWHGAQRFACRIASEGVQLATDGRRWLRFDAQPGLLSVLSDGVVLPEWLGIHRASDGTRLFGWMSTNEFYWKDDAEWLAPTATPMGDVLDAKRNHEDSDTLRAIKKFSPKWIAGDVGPNTAVPGGTIQFFRKKYTNAGTTVKAKILITADDYCTVYWNGEQVYESDRSDLYAWREVQEISLDIVNGEHVLAVEVENRPSDSSGNVLALIAAVVEVDADGKPVSPTGSLFVSDESWEVCIGTPGWHRGVVVVRAAEEARDRGCFPDLVFSFSHTVDSNGDPWTDDPSVYSVSVATDSVLDLTQQMCERDLDVDADPDMHVNAWSRKGSDLSGTVQLDLFAGGGNLLGHETARTGTRYSTVYVQANDRTWHDIEASASIRKERGFQFGSTPSGATVVKLAHHQLDESAQPLDEFVAQPSTQSGPVPYVDYTLGDTILIPKHRGGGHATARVLAITVDGTGDVVKAWPEFSKDGSS